MTALVRGLENAARGIARFLWPLELELDGRTVLVDGKKADFDQRPGPIVPRKLERERAFVKRHGQPAQLVVTSGFEEIAIAAGLRRSRA